jgi:hypothetical protein
VSSGELFSLDPRHANIRVFPSSLVIIENSFWISKSNFGFHLRSWLSLYLIRSNRRPVNFSLKHLSPIR